MRQEVNLYLSEFKPVKLWLSCRNSVVLLVLTIVGLGFYSYQQSSVVNQLSQQHRELTERMKVNVIDYDSSTLFEKWEAEKAFLNDEISQAQTRVAHKQQLQDTHLHYFKQDNINLFNIFWSISRYSNQAIALSEITIADGGELLMLKGIAADKVTVPQFLSQLQNEPRMDRVKLGLLKMTRSGTGQRYEFALSDTAVE